MLEESALVRWTVTLIFAALTGVGVPWLGMRVLVPTLIGSGRRVRNYRGREVYLGLGVVWVFWLLGAAVFLAGTWFAAALWDLPDLVLVGGPLDLGVLLVGGAFVFGLVDDVFGTDAEKGFRGHLGALSEGRLTTGGLKLIGVGVISLLGGFQLVLGEHLTPGTLAHGVAAAAVLALSANTLNLFDLRPGRALKVYAVLASISLAALAVGSLRSGVSSGYEFADTAVVTLFCVGPVLAVARFDLGEAGMLGDAGANGFGMWAGVLFVATMPPLALAVVLAVLLTLNLASERISFSSVIGNSRSLSAIDGWGRVPAGEDSGEVRQ